MITRLSPNISIAQNEDGAVLLDEHRGEYWQLNASGADVLNTLLDGGTAGDAARLHAAHHPITADQAAADVKQLIASLRAARLVEVEEP
ncbi:lasso peptide biosynthesis PqqD family chaperone [Streptomyces sp. NPDC050315]|uniref:lasso peptide biosynthesis PqqD family chaperone n=1 Tax=Streptomyces sp. NPDC050315 TaxID=3155039 RepID=UPI00343E81F6